MIRRFAVIMTILSAFALRLGAQQIVETRLSRDSILIGDQVEWSSRIQAPKGMRIHIDTMSGYVTPGVELIGDFKVDTLKVKKDFANFTTRATITSFDSGVYVIPPVMVYFYNGEELVDTIRMQALPLYVQSFDIDTTTFEMHDLKGQLTYPVTFRETLPWIGLALLIIALAGLAIYLIKRHLAGKSLLGHHTVKDPAHIVALRSLEKTRRSQLWQNGKQKQFYTEVTDAMRVYIEERFAIQSMERTSAEILEDLSKADVRPESFESLKDLFTLSDLVKFAKYTASEAENEGVIPTAVRFVNDTFMQTLEQKEEPKNE